MHTAYSLDAFLGGSGRHPATPTASPGAKPWRSTASPTGCAGLWLDFAAVTDHAEYLGEMHAALNPGAPGHDIPQIEELIGLTDFDERRNWFIEYVVKNNRGAKPQHTSFYPGPAAVRSGWAGSHRCRRAIQRTGGVHHVQRLRVEQRSRRGQPAPQCDFSRHHRPRHSDERIRHNVWKRGCGTGCRAQEEKGARAIALPHNSNASKGNMFPAKDHSGAPLDAGLRRSCAAISSAPSK